MGLIDKISKWKQKLTKRLINNNIINGNLWRAFYFCGIVYFLIIFLNFLFRIKLPPQQNYIQQIYLAFITFSISALWNLYNQIFEAKIHSIGSSAEEIINRKIYQDLATFFMAFLFIPFFILFLLGLIFSFWLSPILNYINIFLSLLLISFYPKITFWIQYKSGIAQAKDKRLEKFIKEVPLNDDLYKVFIEILSYKESEIIEKFNLKPEDWMKLFTFKIDELIKKVDELKEKTTFLELILWKYSFFLENVNLENVLFLSDFFKKFLHWNYIVWQKRKFYTILQARIERIFEIMLKRTLYAESYLYNCFFSDFENHINSYLNKEKKYIKYFLSKFSEIFFEEISESPNEYKIWKGLIPYKWKVTTENLEEKKEVAWIMLNCFFDWAWIKIVNAEEGKFDKKLDNVAYNLFPKTEPTLWASILIFMFSPYSSEEKRVEEVINRPWTFGFSGRVIVYWGKEGIERVFEKKYQEQVKETLKLAKMLFGKTFNQENLEKYLKEIETLEKEYKKDEIKYGRLQKLKLIFEDIKKVETN